MDHGQQTGLSDDDHRQYALMEVSTTQPSDPRTGGLWYDQTNNVLKMWTGSAYVVIPPTVGNYTTDGKIVTTGTTAYTFEESGGACDASGNATFFDGGFSGDVIVGGDVNVSGQTNGWYQSRTLNGMADDRVTVTFMDHFEGDGVQYAWTRSTSGTGANFGTTGTNNDTSSVGFQMLQTGTTSTGRAGIIKGSTAIYLGAGEFTVEWRVRPSGTVIDASNDAVFLFGLTDSNSSTTPTDGVYFKIDRSVDTANWVIGCTASSTATETATSAAWNYYTWQRLTAVINAGATSVTFSINGSPVGTITTNIPSGSSNGTSIGCIGQKSAGTSNRYCIVDYAAFKMVRTTGLD